MTLGLPNEDIETLRAALRGPFDGPPLGEGDPLLPIVDLMDEPPGMRRRARAALCSVLSEYRMPALLTEDPHRIAAGPIYYSNTLRRLRAHAVLALRQYLRDQGHELPVPQE